MTMREALMLAIVTVLASAIAVGLVLAIGSFIDDDYIVERTNR